MSGSNKENEKLTGLVIEEIKCCITKKNNPIIKIYYLDYKGEIVEKELRREQLIEFDIRSLGFSKRYFRSKVRNLKKCDYLRTSTYFKSSNIAGYNFLFHSKKIKLKELTISKDIGWSFGTEELSDSYILYKKIQGNKLKIKILEYVTERLNDGFNTFVPDSGGKLIANIRRIYYDKLWEDYLEGKVTGTELSSILFNLNQNN